MTHPATLVTLAGVGTVLGLAGPFGTDARLPLLPRVVYWLAVAWSSYAVGVLCGELLGPRLRGAPGWIRVAAIGGVAGLGISLLVLAANTVVFRYWPDGRALAGLVATICATSVIVTAVLQVVGRHLGPVKDAAPTVPAPPPLLERLPLDRRGPLIALSVEDHYVRVRTTRGETLLLMRLSDAIREVGDTPGAQVHRSHWVAFSAVAAARRAGDRAILTLTTGVELPVSRANVAKIREAGLLPR